MATQELTQELEKIVKEFESRFGGFIATQSKRQKQDKDNDWLRTHLLSLAERAEERGKEAGEDWCNSMHGDILERAKKEGAQAMKEKAIACVPREWESSVGNYNGGFCDAVSQILSALTNLSLTNE